MSLAFEQVCQNLGLRVQDDPATRIVAERIIALTQSGASDVDTLRENDSSRVRQMVALVNPGRRLAYIG
jgi:hypothetical protein